MPGKVIQGHAKYEDDCKNCHKRFDKAAQDRLCMDCHKEIGNDVAQKQGYHGKQMQQKECRGCHTEHKGRLAKIVHLDEKTFRHAETDFVLKGKHAEEQVKCEDCHKLKEKMGNGKPMRYRDAPHDCVDCHKKDDDKAHHGRLGRDCAKCHGEKDWKVPDFDHSKTDFDLRGKHVDVKCKECHIDGRYKDTPTRCVECHRKDDDKSHKGVFGQKCEKCHGEKSWKEDILFNHDQDTKFPLRDKHRDAKCSSCHKAQDEKLKTACVSCHRKDDKHNGTLGEKCDECHNARDWKSPKGFDHDKDTQFPLRDKHKEAKCDKCHTTGHRYEKLALDCWSCHKQDDEKAHRGNFGHKCETCHKENDWKKPFFNHDKDTRYPLRFKHFDVKCDKCHTGRLYEQKLRDVCYDCHKKTDEDKGHHGNLGEKCEKCHSEKGWTTDVKFDHDKDTKYPLRFKHREVKCDKCHTTPAYREKTSSECYACHKKDDKHNGQEGRKCEECHNEKSWKGKDVRFDHNKSRFPLLGAHVKTACDKCHETPEFKNAKSDCYACHQKDDKHELRLGRKCEVCHNARDWKIWDFDHDKRTRYKIDGAHKKASCEDCHKQPARDDKLGTPNTCYGCHSESDIHEGSFGQQCERCHTTRSFKEVRPKVH